MRIQIDEEETDRLNLVIGGTFNHPAPLAYSLYNFEQEGDKIFIFGIWSRKESTAETERLEVSDRGVVNAEDNPGFRCLAMIRSKNEFKELPCINALILCHKAKSEHESGTITWH